VFVRGSGVRKKRVDESFEKRDCSDAREYKIGEARRDVEGEEGVESCSC